jgi:tetratricopeptide (TPR) repeat protein
LYVADQQNKLAKALPLLVWLLPSGSLLGAAGSGINGAVSVIAGERSWYAYGLSCCLVLALLAIAFAIVLVRKSPGDSILVSSSVVSPPRREYRFARAVRLLTAVLAGALLVGFGAFTLRFRGDHYARNARIVVLVADFPAVAEGKSGVTQRLLTELRDFARRDPRLEVIALGREISEAEGPATARSWGERYVADLVVWGWYDVYAKDAQVVSHVEVLLKDLDVPTSSGSMIFTGSLKGLERFAINESAASSARHLMLFILSARYFYDARYKDALLFLHEDGLLQSWPSNIVAASQLYFLRGVAHLKIGEAAKAASDLAKAAETKPPVGNVHFNLGLAMFMLNRPSEAIQAFVKSAEENNWQLLVVRGASRLKIGDEVGGFEDIKRARALAPNQIGPAGALGIYYVRKKDWLNAEDALTTALAIGHEPNLFYQRALVNRQLGKLEAAEHDLTAAIREAQLFDRSRPDMSGSVKISLAPLFWERSRVRYDTGNPDGAIADFAEFVKLQPFLQKPIQEYMQLANTLRLPKGGVAVLIRPYSNSPTDAAQREFVRGIYELQSVREAASDADRELHNKQAQIHFTLANELAPHHYWIVRNLSLCLVGSKDHSSAARLARELLTLPEASAEDHQWLKECERLVDLDEKIREMKAQADADRADSRKG